MDLCSTLADPVVVETSAQHESGLVVLVVAHASGGSDLTLVQAHRLGPDGFAVISSVTGADADSGEGAH